MMRPNMTLPTTKDPRVAVMNMIVMMIVIMNTKKSKTVADAFYKLIFFISLQMDPSLIDVNKTILKTY